MIRYFFNFVGKKTNLDEDQNHYRLYAIIDDRYYWTAEWYSDTVLKKEIIQSVNGGFITKEIIAEYKSLPEIDFITIKERFNLFASFIERAVNGFKSYIIWISPDPQKNDIPWQILNN